MIEICVFSLVLRTNDVRFYADIDVLTITKRVISWNCATWNAFHKNHECGCTVKCLNLDKFGDFLYFWARSRWYLRRNFHLFSCFLKDHHGIWRQNRTRVQTLGRSCYWLSVGGIISMVWVRLWCGFACGVGSHPIWCGFACKSGVGSGWMRVIQYLYEDAIWSEISARYSIWQYVLSQRDKYTLVPDLKRTHLK